MADPGIHPRRINRLNDSLPNGKGKYVLFWMQQSQRVSYNHALSFAIEQANTLHQPVLAVFGLTPDYPDANWRHFAFMLQGLAEVEQSLADMGIALRICIGVPAEVALKASRNASLIVCDRGYLRHQRQWRSNLASKATCQVLEVESDAIIPVEIVSSKAEYAARTIRPKIHYHLPTYLVPMPETTPKRSGLDLSDRTDFTELATHLKGNRSINAVTPLLKGGYSNALNRLYNFIINELSGYPDRRNAIEAQGSSQMSPYLHFGQISSLEIALAIQRSEAPAEAKEAFWEELIVRRELAINHVWFNPLYDQYKGLPQWARRTLANHRADTREPKYSYHDLESAQTHDPFWNACMREMRETGYMPNYMRMYWGKKILQWQSTPWQAFSTVLRLNNTYFVDGRDPNSYAGVGWIFGLHDRPWQERPIFGKIRFMARSGLERKFNMQAYLDRVTRRTALIQDDM